MNTPSALAPMPHGPCVADATWEPGAFAPGLVPRAPEAASRTLDHLIAARRVLFPALGASREHGLRVFADNSSRAQMPATTLAAVSAQLEGWETQRGGQPDWDSPRAARAAQLRTQAREAAAQFCGGQPDWIGFAANGTATLAILAYALLGKVLVPGDTVVITEADHDANRHPWQALGALGCRVIDVPVAPDGGLDMTVWREALKQNPKVVALCMVSNVTGVVLPYAELTREAHASGAVVVLDAVQGPPHGYAEVMQAGVDAAIFSNCKLFAPHLGWWAVRPELLARMGLEPARGSHPSLEWGTFAHAAFAGFVATHEYFCALAAPGGLPAGMAAIRGHEADLVEHFLAELPSAARPALLAARSSHPRVPIFSLALPRARWDAARQAFGEAGIDVRIGQFGCPATLARLASHTEAVALRLSFVHYNSADDIEQVCRVAARVWRE